MPPPTPLEQLARRTTSTMSNPYRIVERWPTLRDGMTWGAAIGIIPDNTGGAWMMFRSEPPINYIDASGTITKSFGRGLLVQAHGFCMDHDGNLWVGDSGPFAEDPATKGRGFQLHKLTQDGELLFSFGPGGRLACRHRHVHRSDRVRRRGERRHHRRRRPLAAPDERAAGRRSHRAAETGRHLRARRRQSRRGPGSVHGPARVGVRLARPAVRRRPLEQPRAGARRELRVRRRVAAFRPPERRGDPQGRHVDRCGLGIHELHRRPARRRPRAAGACCATRAGKPAFGSAARSTARCVSSYRARGPKGWPATSSATFSPGSRGAATRARPAVVCKSG